MNSLSCYEDLLTPHTLKSLQKFADGIFSYGLLHTFPCIIISMVSPIRKHHFTYDNNKIKIKICSKIISHDIYISTFTIHSFWFISFKNRGKQGKKKNRIMIKYFLKHRKDCFTLKVIFHMHVFLDHKYSEKLPINILQ